MKKLLRRSNPSNGFRDQTTYDEQKCTLAAKCAVCEANRHIRVVFSLLKNRATKRLKRSYNFCDECGRWVCDKCFLISFDKQGRGVCLECAKKLGLRGKTTAEIIREG